MKQIFIIIHLVFATLVTGCKSENTTSSIKMDEFIKIYNKDNSIRVIDVRESHEYFGPLKHIPNAELMPLSDQEKLVSNLKNAENLPLYIICRSGNRSQTATALLRKNGIDAINIEGGMKAWNSKSI